MKNTRFSQITASPEVLAENLVFQVVLVDGEIMWFSVISEKVFKNQKEAYAETLARLYEENE